MDNQNNPNSGVLFSAKAKTNPKAPDYKGAFSIDLRSVERDPHNENIVNFKLSGWKRVSKGGNTFLSLALDTYKPDQQPTVQPKETSHDEDPFN